MKGLKEMNFGINRIRMMLKESTREVLCIHIKVQFIIIQKIDQEEVISKDQLQIINQPLTITLQSSNPQDQSHAHIIVEHIDQNRH
jgi:hypothetical protein